MYCRNCGAPLAEDAKFCTVCGVEVPVADAAAGARAERAQWAKSSLNSLNGLASNLQTSISGKGVSAKIHLTGVNLLLVVGGITMAVTALILVFAIFPSWVDILEIIDLYDDDVAILGSVLLGIFGIAYIYVAVMPVAYTIMDLLGPSARFVGAAWRSCCVFVIYGVIMWLGSECFDEPSLMGDSLKGVLYLAFGSYGALLKETLLPGLIALFCATLAFYLSGATTFADYWGALNPKTGYALDVRKMLGKKNGASGFPNSK